MGRKAKLTQEQAFEIREKIGAGASMKDMSEYYACNIQTIRKVVTGRHPYLLPTYDGQGDLFNANGTINESQQVS